MSKTMRVIRWIGVVPSFIVGYVIGNLLFTFTSGGAWPFSVWEMSGADSFLGHNISGPVFVFFNEFTAFGFAYYLALRIAPSHKKQVLSWISGVVAILLLVAIFISGVLLNYVGWTSTIRSLVELAAWLVIVIIFTLNTKDIVNDLEFEEAVRLIKK